MKKVNNHTILSELLIEHCELIPIVNRFGIGFGLEEKSIQEVCDENGIDVYFVLTVLNLFLDTEYDPALMLSNFDITTVLEYLSRSVETYINYSISNIEKHFMPLFVMNSSVNKDLELLHHLFYRFKAEISERIQNDLEHICDYPIEILNDLKTIMIKHISNPMNQNLAYAVVFSLHTLEKELAFHNLILNRILRPKLDELDAEKIENLNYVFNEDHKNNNSESQLTNREIEVLKLIVQGLMNKEIADKLNISFNTVLSHRKNIISKTGIKTVSGLIFYSISKGYVSPGSVKI